MSRKLMKFDSTSPLTLVRGAYRKTVTVSRINDMYQRCRVERVKSRDDVDIVGYGYGSVFGRRPPVGRMGSDLKFSRFGDGELILELLLQEGRTIPTR